MGRGRHRILCRVFATAEGYIVHLLGGTRPHVGAIALGLPRPSLKGTHVSSTASVLTLLGHKDDELARPAALSLAAALNAPVVVVAGVHVDDPGPGELLRLATNARRAVWVARQVLTRRPRNQEPSK